MIEDVIALPIRLGLTTTRLGLKVAGEAVSLGLHATERVAGIVLPQHDEAPPAPEPQAAEPPVAEAPAPPRPARPRRSPEPSAVREPVTPPAPAPAPPAAPEPPPAHVSREAELVEAFAEPGAENGAGAAVRVAEPWKGYRSLTAGEVVDRLAAASREELAAVTLYENAHRRRRTVLAEADRRLKQASVPNAR